MSDPDSPLLSLTGIRKVFPGCIANDAIDLDANQKPVEESLAKVAPDLVFVEVTLD